jgi:hypothetical protein
MLEGPEVREAENEKVPATVITLTVPFEDGKHVVLQTFMARDAPTGDYHGVVDKLYCVVERQKWKSDIVGLKGAIEQDERLQEAQMADLIRIETKNALDWELRGKKGEPKLSNAEEAHRIQVRNNVTAIREGIAKKRALVDKLEGKLLDEPVTGER